MKDKKAVIGLTVLLAVASAGMLPVQAKEKTLMVYCGAGMKEPFEKIAQAYEESSGYKMEVLYANAAQIQTQIRTTQEGDFFIAGARGELEPVKDQVAETLDLVKHIPVIAVEKGNPKNIQSPRDLGKEGIRVVTGDPQSTPIGKIAAQVFADFQIEDKVDILSTTATAPAMVTALENGECDCVLVWKENVDEEKAELAAPEEMEAYTKTIPAAALKCTSDETAQRLFLEYLQEEEAQEIWTSYGYGLIQEK